MKYYKLNSSSSISLIRLDLHFVKVTDLAHGPSNLWSSDVEVNKLSNAVTDFFSERKDALTSGKLLYIS